MRRGHLYRVTRLSGGITPHPNLGGQAMADNDDKEDGAEAAAAPKKSRKKLIIMAAAALLLVGGGAATWFLFFRAHGEEVHAEAAAPKAPLDVTVPPSDIKAPAAAPQEAAR